MQDAKNILLNVLTIIGYTDDKHTFINEFIVLCKKLVVYELINSLSIDMQNTLKKELFLVQKSNPEKIHEILTRYYTLIEYEQTLKAVTQKQFQSYLQAVYPTLSTEQANALDTYLASLTIS